MCDDPIVEDDQPPARLRGETFDFISLWRRQKESWDEIAKLCYLSGANEGKAATGAYVKKSYDAEKKKRSREGKV
jgi:hypothetical protein